jgi:hypothetical protein
MINILRRPIAIFLSILLALMPLSAAQAAMIGNDQIVNKGSAHQMRDSLKQQFERETVQQQLQAWGIHQDHIKNRIDSLTDDEVAQIYQQINDPRAGGDALGILLTIFLVFVITDIIGATDIFPFINPVN